MVTPPNIHRGACIICRGNLNPNFTICWRCEENKTRLGGVTADIVVPISLAVPGSSGVEGLGQLVHELYTYKDTTIPAQQTAPFVWGLTTVLWRFLSIHQKCIMSAINLINFDLIASVPSTSGRSGTHPLEAIIQSMYGTRYTNVLKTTQQQIERREASKERFEVNIDVTNKTILLIDDTWTTGAKAQSAAASLKRAGAGKVAVVVVGRYFRADPRLGPPGRINRTFLAQVRLERPFTWDKCCLDWDNQATSLPPYG